MRIEVLRLDPVVKEAKYFHYTIHYLNDGKEFKRKLVSFSTGKLPYDALKAAKPGEKYDIKLEKDENGNWFWSEVIKVTGEAMSAKDGTTGKAGNWETTEERARRQILIVRQSCLAQAVAMNEGISEDEIIKLAEKFEAWVNRE